MLLVTVGTAEIAIVGGHYNKGDFIPSQDFLVNMREEFQIGGFSLQGKLGKVPPLFKVFN